ncbi:MAG: hypothetical protein U9N11_00380, partial [Campylobacterota bacterium]|nr:hypothetical protein [Campylobacterota bacterium]
GAERSSFRLKVEDYDARLQQLYPSISSSLDDNKQVALSDIYIEDFDTIEYMVNDGYIAHAHMDRCNTKHGKATGKYNKSSQKHFIPKGSVIYFKDGFDVNSLDVKIGYNTVIKTKEN